MSGRPIRVLHAPWDVGGHPSTLAAAERRRGLDSRCVTLTPSPFGYEGARSLTRAGATPATVELARLRLLAHALRWADVVHFNFGAPILAADVAPTPASTPGGLGGLARRTYRAARRTTSGADLALLHRLGRPAVVTFQGDDARPTVGHLGGLDPDPALDQRRATLIAQFDRATHSMFALNPDLLDVLPARAEFFPYANVDLRGITPTPLPDGTTVRVAHAPTNRLVKGTSVVVDAVEALRRDGVRIELDLIEGVSNGEVLARLANAHVVVDQLRLGWYGGLAVEAMAAGRPVIAHVDGRYESRLPSTMWADLPIVEATADTIADTLRSFADGTAADRQLLADRSRAFAERWHDPDVLAARTEQTYRAALDR